MKSMKMALLISIIASLVACKKNIPQKDIFLTGDTDGTFYELITPPVSIVPLDYSECDTVTKDTLEFDVNKDQKADFIFVLNQKFQPSQGYGFSAAKQEIIVFTADDVWLQLDEEFSKKDAYVKSVNIGDTIDNSRDWVFKSRYNLSSRFRNAGIAFKNDTQYIPFRLGFDSYGWFKFGIDYNWDGDVEFIRFYVDEYCIK